MTVHHVRARPQLAFKMPIISPRAVMQQERMDGRLWGFEALPWRGNRTRSRSGRGKICSYLHGDMEVKASDVCGASPLHAWSAPWPMITSASRGLGLASLGAPW
jgi:hypothetical protein